MKEIVLDTETTGLSIKDGHRIVEIGCIELDNLVPTSNKFHCYLNPERKVSDKALEVHGYSNEFLEDKKKFERLKVQLVSISNLFTMPLFTSKTKNTPPPAVIFFLDILGTFSKIFIIRPS